MNDTTKQKQKPNSLSHVKKTNRGIVDKTSTDPLLSGSKPATDQSVAATDEKKNAVKNTTAKPKVTTKKKSGKKSGGRPKKPANEVQTNRVQLMLTDEEYSKLEKEAGDIPLGPFVKSKMRRAGIL